MSRISAIRETNERATQALSLGLVTLVVMATVLAISATVSSSDAYQLLAFGSMACAFGLVRLKTDLRLLSALPDTWSDGVIVVASIPFLGPYAGIASALATLARLASHHEDHSLRHAATEALRNCAAGLMGGLAYMLVVGQPAGATIPVAPAGVAAGAAAFVVARFTPLPAARGRVAEARPCLPVYGAVALVGSLMVFWLQYCPRTIMIVTGALVTVAYAAKGLAKEPVALVIDETAQAVEQEAESPIPVQTSMIDPLTGLANDRYLYVFLQQEIGRSVRKSLPLSLLLLDIDNFQSINENYGQTSADAAMVELGKLIRDLIREYDLVARCSSDEFAVVLPEASCSNAFETAERIREKAADYDFGKSVKVRVSLGVATYPEHGMTPDNLMSSAHHALNRAKFSGKDQVISCTEIVSKLRYGT